MGGLIRRDVEEDVLTLGRERVAEMFERYDHVAVSFSGGKDSTCVLHLCLDEARRRGQDLDVVFFDEEAIHPPTIEYVDRVSRVPGVKLRWLCWPIKHRNGCSRREPHWYPWAPEARELWCRPYPEQGLQPPPGWNEDVRARRTMPASMGPLFAPELGTVGLALGIRAQESLRRYLSVSSRVHDNWISVDQEADRPGIYKCKPIYDWQTEDVWTFPEKMGLDYNRAYDVLQAAGLTPYQQRIGPPYGEEPLNMLWCYAVCFPDLWERMVNRVAGAATAARYAKSPLYAGGGGATEPPEGWTWQQLVLHEIGKWPEGPRRAIAQRVRDEIAAHNRLTGNRPIAERESEGGLSWQFLHQVVRRGDFKKRKKVDAPVKSNAAELRELEADIGRRLEATSNERRKKYLEGKLSKVRKERMAKEAEAEPKRDADDA